MSAPHSYSQEHYLLCDNREKNCVTKLSAREKEKREQERERDVKMFETNISENKGRTSHACTCYEVVLQPKSGLFESPSQTET